MHELSIALGIVDLAAEESRRRGDSRVLAVHLKVGRLSGVVADALRNAFELAREQESSLANADLVIEDVPISAYCPKCQTEQAPDFPRLCCPVCGTATPEVLRGKELEVVALELESS